LNHIIGDNKPRAGKQNRDLRITHPQN
jgi:hypothetical protein